MLEDVGAGVYAPPLYFSLDLDLVPCGLQNWENKQSTPLGNVSLTVLFNRKENRQ